MSRDCSETWCAVSSFRDVIGSISHTYACSSGRHWVQDLDMSQVTTLRPYGAQSERNIQTWRICYRAVLWILVADCWILISIDWVFFINNSYHTSIKVCTFEACMGGNVDPRNVIWTVVGEKLAYWTGNYVKLLKIRVGDRSVMKVSPWKGMCCVHDTFHVSNLKKCLAEPDVQVPLDEIEIDENLRFVEEPLEIVERDVKKLKRRIIPLVKVRWNSRQGAELFGNEKTQFTD
ncbi:hypothetical protein Tco_0153145 [Tanacetum coccineum]